ncbi:hypothetical protein EDD96_4535 [Streptomyces sp. Ag109_G2-6]|uniref:hypothetical protein n=1 Tax=Streptomyces TaxID=1883 RepID=UPI0009A537A8|nr:MULTISPECIES: hypothetical protein [Streptomyces]RPF40758.1 hypothetical protein EDD96_4535 [Streptomyces sp. Ag109_G2-6]
MVTYTVTVAGSERYDGEEPYTYVTCDDQAINAVLRVMAHHRWENEDDDVIPISVFTGEPGPDCGYCWNELRET